MMMVVSCACVCVWFVMLWPTCCDEFPLWTFDCQRPSRTCDGLSRLKGRPPFYPPQSLYKNKTQSQEKELCSRNIGTMA